MSAIAIDPQELYAAPARRSTRAGRGGHLRLVPGGAITRDGAVREVPAQRRRRPGARVVGAVAPAAMQITRRGRLALTTSAALVLTIVLASLLGVWGTAEASPSGYLVEPGMTLSQIAAEQLPDRPLSQAVVDIQRANKLSGTSLAAGQVLVIPGR